MAGGLGKFFGLGNSKIKRSELEALKRREAEAAKAKELRASIVKQVKEDLWKALQNREEEHLMFVCGQDLEGIWSISRIEQLFKGFDWSHSRPWARIQEEFVKVLSTLVWIGWDSWDDFGHLFLEHVNNSGHLDRTDKHLPLEDTSFLEPDKLRTFFRNQQYIFIPVFIMEDDEELDLEYMQYSEKHRMPFLGTEVIGEGGSGIVTKEIIPPGQFGFKNGTCNSKPLPVARKRIPRARTLGSRVDLSFSTELKSLKSFKRCLEKNGNIMLSYCSFSHGPDVTIISPLADLDLHTFFKGRYSDFSTRSSGFTPLHLLYGASCLAGALSFLHEGLQMGIAGKIFCAHLDLKPENILVVWKGNSEAAGRWLVHDFGTSKIKEKSSAPTLAPGDFLRQFSLTQPQRAPGPFQAPEVERSNERVVGTESDIWSLGCILAVVLAFALGGPSHVTRLANSRAQEGCADDYFYVRRESRVTLKEEVRKWLDSFYTGRTEDIWIKETLALIYSTLVEKPTARPSAKVVKETLEAIYAMDGIDGLRKTCPWAPVELPCIPSPRPATVLQNRPLSGPEPQRDIPRMLVERPTFINIESGLEVVEPSRLSSPQSGSTSQFPSDRDSYVTEDRRASGKPVSRSSSTSTKPVSLTDDITYMKVEVPKDTFKAVICHSACHAIFLSKKRATIVRLSDEGPWLPPSKKSPGIYDGSWTRSIDSSDGFELEFGCSSGRYLILRSKKLGGRERKVLRYHCDESGRNWLEQPLPFSENVPMVKLWNALDIAVSIHGAVLFVCDANLWFYSQQHGFLELITLGRHRTDSACFSPNGRWIFAWSHEPQYNHFYKWDTMTRVRIGNTNPTKTLKPEWHIRAIHNTAPRPGTGVPAIFPFLDYFVAFDIPDRVYTIGKDVSQPSAIPIPREVRDIVAGVSIQGLEGQPRVESLILLQNSSKGLLMTLPMTFNGADSPSDGSKLRYQFTVGKDAIAVLNTDSKFYVIVAHADGKLERRRISST